MISILYRTVLATCEFVTASQFAISQTLHEIYAPAIAQMQMCQGEGRHPQRTVKYANCINLRSEVSLDMANAYLEHVTSDASNRDADDRN